MSENNGGYPPQNPQGNQYGQNPQGNQYPQQSGQPYQHSQGQPSYGPPQGYPNQGGDGRPQWPGGQTHHQPAPQNSNRGFIIGLVTLGLITVAAVIAAILFGTGVLGGKDNGADPAPTVAAEETQTESPTDEATGGATTDPAETDSPTADPTEDATTDGPRVADPTERGPLDPITDPVVPSSDLTWIDGETFKSAPLPGSSVDVLGYRVEAANADPAHTVTVFFDYSCPHCVDFEAQYGEELAQLVQEGKIALDLRVLSFLPTEFSPVAAEAMRLVGGEAPDQLIAFHNELMKISGENAQNPDPLEAIRAAATAVGVPENVVASITSTPNHPWALSLTNEVPAGFEGTPTVLFDGEELRTMPPGGFAELAN